MIQPSIERTATAPEEVCWSVEEGLAPLRGGELSTSISLEAMGADVVWVSDNGVGLGKDAVVTMVRAFLRCVWSS